MRKRPDSNSKFIEEENKTARESIGFFSNNKKSEREIWVCREFLKNYNIEVSNNALILGDDPPDVKFGSTRFEVKEIIDEGRKRHGDYKKHAKRVNGARSLSDLLEPYNPPKKKTPADIKDIISKEVRGLSSKYATSIKQSLDLLFYVNLKDTFVGGTSISVPENMENIAQWRSVSFVSNNCSGVIWTNGNAPDFLRERIGTIVHKNPTRS